MVVGAGDYATIRIGLERTMETLSVIATATVLVPGNAESDTELWRGLRGVAERRRPSRPGEGDCGRPVLWARGRGPSDAVSVELRPERGRGCRQARALPRGGCSGGPRAAEGLRG